MALKQAIYIVLFFFVATLQAQRIAIMGAMDEEIELLKSELTDIEKIEKDGVTFFTGNLRGKEVVLLKVGIGKVNAAYGTAILIANFEIQVLIFTGVAGGLHPEIQPGDIVIADKMVQYDFGKLSDGKFVTWPTRNLADNNAKNPLYLAVDSILLEKGKKVSEHIALKPLNGRVPKFYVGTIATGDTFVNDPKKAEEIYSNFEALATEMEGAAVAQICTMLKVPYIVIRSCSDNANNAAHIDYSKFVKVASINSAEMVLGLLEAYKVN